LDDLNAAYSAARIRKTPYQTLCTTYQAGNYRVTMASTVPAHLCSFHIFGLLMEPNIISGNSSPLPLDSFLQSLRGIAESIELTGAFDLEPIRKPASAADTPL
jgi:hypothetical protein